ncbi:MAG: BNR-repeat neuraminidase N-terminal domain-containing protein, partial [Flavobacteriales bacterium]
MTKQLSDGNNYFWLAYDIADGATKGNEVDARCDSIKVDGTTRTPTTTDPSGTRPISLTPVLNSSTTLQPNTYPIGQGTDSNEVLKIELDVGGSSAKSKDVTQLSFNTNGCSDASNDIDTARLFYTGNNSTFSDTNEVGKTANPSGSFTISGTQSVNGGKKRYF